MFSRGHVAAGIALALAVAHGVVEVRAASVEAGQAEVVSHLADDVHLRIGLGDGRGAALAFTTLAAADDGSARGVAAALAVLNIYETAPGAGEIRAALTSRDREARAKAFRQLADALAEMTGEHRLPEPFTGHRILKAAEGCPVEQVRAFAQGHDGAVHMLAGALVSYDGRLWQVADRESIRAVQPLAAILSDSKGRLWIGGGQAGIIADGPLTATERPGWGTTAFRQGGPGGRWHTFTAWRRVTAFAENKMGVWVATPSWLSVYGGRQMRPVNCPLPYSPTRKLVASLKSDDLWVVDVGRVSRFDGKRWKSYSAGKLRTVGGVISNGRVVIVTSAGLIVPGDERSEMVKFPAGHGTIVAAAAGPDDTIWCVSSQGRLARTNMKTWGLYRLLAPNELARHVPPAIFCDAAGRVWLSRGRGVEVHAAGRKASTTIEAEKNEIVLSTVPLVSAAGSGGWPSWGRSVTIPEAEEAGADARALATESVDALAAFDEDDAGDAGGAQGLFDKLKKWPRSDEVFTQLMKALEERPDPKLRRQTFVLATKERNVAFFANLRLVREFTETLIDEGLPVQACMLAVEAAVIGRPGPVSGELDVAIREALVAMGFGEFARPSFFAIDARIWAEDPVRGRRSARFSNQTFKPGVRAMTFQVQADTGREQLRKAGLHTAVILADKRAVLASLGDFGRWLTLVKDCVAAGDAEAAKKYRRLTWDMFPWPKDLFRTERPAKADSVSLSPYRWMRRVKIGADSGFGPLGVVGDSVLLVDAADNSLVSIAADTGSVTRQATTSGEVRAVITGPGSMALIVRQKDGRMALEERVPLPPGVSIHAIAGFTDAFDGFSVTPVVNGAFYCFDNGLTKVRVANPKVVWRNEDFVGGSYPSRFLLERSLPVADGGDVFLVSDGTLVCIDDASGKERWKTQCGWSGTPVLVGGLVVVGTGSREVWGLDRKTGRRVWRHAGRGSARAQLVSDGTRIFVSLSDGDVAALVADSGRLLWRRSTKLNVRPVYGPTLRQTALIVRGERLVACNLFGYIEFDAKSGAVLRRLDITTSRPMAATKDAVIVMTDPRRLVAVADEQRGGLAEKVLALTAGAPKERAAAMARLAAGYIHPGSTKAHKAALALSTGLAEADRRALYATMVASVDPFSPGSRKLMRDHLALLPSAELPFGRVAEIIADVHLQRGGAAEAAAAFRKATNRQATLDGLVAQLRLELAAGEDEAAKSTVRRLVAIKLAGAPRAFSALESAHREEQALAIVSPQGSGGKGAMALLRAAVSLSAATGLTAETERALAGAEHVIGPARRGQLLAHILSTAQVADRVLLKRKKELRKRLATYRDLLSQRRDVLKANERADELKIVEEQLKRLEKPLFP